MYNPGSVTQLQWQQVSTNFAPFEASVLSSPDILKQFRMPQQLQPMPSSRDEKFCEL